MPRGAVEADRMTLADMEIYGLSPRSASCLERWFGVLYVDEVECYPSRKYRRYRGPGTQAYRELVRALKNLRAGVVVKTVEECIRW